MLVPVGKLAEFLGAMILMTDDLIVTKYHTLVISDPGRDHTGIDQHSR